MPLYCVCNSTEVYPRVDAPVGSNYRLPDFRRPIDQLVLQLPMECIRTGAASFTYDNPHLVNNHQNVDVFQCPRCKTMVAK